MEAKHYAFIAALMVFVSVGTVLGMIDRRIRTAAFFLLVFGTVLDTNVGDINFLSREWYRGTTRGIEVSWLDAVGAVTLFSTVLSRLSSGQRVFFWPAGLGPMVLFFMWGGLSSVLSDPSLFGIFEWSKLGRGIFLFITTALFVQDRRTLLVLVTALATALIYEGGIAFQHRYIYGYHRIGGTLQHPNSLSLYCCIATPVLIAASLSEVSKKVRLMCAAAAAAGFICVLLTISRSGVAVILVVSAGAAVACTGLRVKLTPRTLALLTLVTLVVGALIIRASGTIMARMNSEEADKSERSSYYQLAGAMVAAEPLGVGLNNWSWAVSNQYGYSVVGMPYVAYTSTDEMPSRVPLGGIDAAQAPPAHSLLALTLGETGYVGLLLLLWCFARWFWSAGYFIFHRDKSLMTRVGIGAFFSVLGAFGQGLTEWAFRQTNVFFVFHIVVGATASLYYIHRRRAKMVRRRARA